MGRIELSASQRTLRLNAAALVQNQETRYGRLLHRRDAEHGEAAQSKNLYGQQVLELQTQKGKSYRLNERLKVS